MSLVREVVTAAGVAGLYLLTFTAAELWRQSGRPHPESTRKLVHVAAGCIALAFPFIFASHWTVLVLASLFALQLLFTSRVGGLRSVHGVERRTAGAFLYPVAIYSLFLLSSATDTPQFYVAALLVLAVSDALAGIVGRSYGAHGYRIGRDTKSLEGSLAFLGSAFAILICVLLASGVVFSTAAGLALAAASFATGLEAISGRGLDNITVPLGTWGALMLGIGATERVAAHLLTPVATILRHG